MHVTIQTPLFMDIINNIHSGKFILTWTRHTVSLSPSLGEEIANSILLSHLGTDSVKWIHSCTKNIWQDYWFANYRTWTRTMFVVRYLHRITVYKQIPIRMRARHVHLPFALCKDKPAHNISKQTNKQTNKQTPKRLLYLRGESAKTIVTCIREHVETFGHNTKIFSKTCQQDLSSCERSNAVLHNIPNPYPE